MSYDLMVFDASKAPRKKADFMDWYLNQTKWIEDHNYLDHTVTTAPLRRWYIDIIRTYPPLGDSDLNNNWDAENEADYSIGKTIIYVAFPWSVMADANIIVRELAIKHNLGFFDVSAGNGEILYPNKSYFKKIKKLLASKEKINSQSFSKETVFTNLSITTLIKDMKDVLIKQGMIFPNREGKTVFFYKELDINRYSFSFTIKKKSNALDISFDIAFVSNSIGNAINFIKNRSEITFPSGQYFSSDSWRSDCSMEWTVDNFDYKNAREITKKIHSKAEIWVINNSYKKRQEYLLSTIDVPGSHQIWHIAALAATKDINTLNSYLAGLELEDRGGLYPYITKEIIERAIEFTKD